HTGLITAALASAELTAANVRTAMSLARREGTPEIVAALEKKAATFPAEAAAPVVTIPPAVLQTYAGSYRNENAGALFTVTFGDGQLSLVTAPGQPALALIPSAQDTFGIAEAPNVTFTFAGRGG